MFFTLLLVTFLLAAAVSLGVVMLFRKPIQAIFERIIKDDISSAWVKYITFAAFVVGISGGVRIYQLERYITAGNTADNVLTLTRERWTMEVYRTVIETMQSIAWMYLVVFIFALLAFVIVRGFEFRKAHSQSDRT